MTEEEAGKKWCPFARVSIAVRPSDDLDHASNRPEHDAYNCIASACMAWRTASAEMSGPLRVLPYVLGPPYNAWKCWVITDPEPDDRSYVETDHPGGFCGLAGAPQ